jgi:ABC-type nitrate/sulfonate/bicarbonate transport system substrate-binding protein
MRRRAVSKTLASVVLIIIVVAAAGAFYTYSTGLLFPKQPPQTFRFGIEHSDATHAVTEAAVGNLGAYNLKAVVNEISDPSALTSAAANGQIDAFVFQFPTTTINAIEKGANVVAFGEESTSFLQDFVVRSGITTFKQTNGTTLAAFQLDGPVLFPPVYQSYGENFSLYNINLVVVGDSSVKSQALIAGRFDGAFLDPGDAVTVFKAAPGKFHVLGTTSKALPGIGGGIYFANRDWLKNHYDQALGFIKAVLVNTRSAYSDQAAWIQSTYNANFSGSDFQVFNSTEHLLLSSDYFSPNMITYTPSLMNASDAYMAFGGLINSTGNVNQIYNFTVVKAALDSLGRVGEPAGPYANLQPLAISPGVLSGLTMFAAPAVSLLQFARPRNLWPG